MGLSGIQRPQVKVWAGSVTSATAKVDLAATYGDVGSALDMNNMSNPTAYLAEIANAENAVVKWFLSPDPTQPTSSTGHYQLTNAAGAEIEVTIVQNTSQVYPLNASAYWGMIQGKGAAGTDADLRAFLTGNFSHDGHGSRMKVTKLTVISTATALTGTPTLTGNVVNIRGLSNLTLFVFNSDASVTGVLTPYVAFGANAPSSLANMYPLDGTNGTALTFSTLGTERAAHPLTGITGDWLGFAMSGSGADVVVYVMGTVEGFEGH